MSLDGPYFECFVIILGLLGSAFFSGAETALTALSETKARQLIDEKKSLIIQLALIEKKNSLLTEKIDLDYLQTLSGSI